MSAGIELEALGIVSLARYVRELPEIANEAAFLSVSDTSKSARAAAARKMVTTLTWPKSYLDNGRLGIAKRATRSDLTAEIKGRDRPTSLARFSATPVRFGRQQGIKVSIVRGKGQPMMRRAFYMRLKRGRSMDTENPNVGLAVRLGKGESLSNSVGALDIGGGVYLLYGPSVNQVFGNVADDILDDVSDSLNDRFIYHYTRLSNARQ